MGINLCRIKLSFLNPLIVIKLYKWRLSNIYEKRKYTYILCTKLINMLIFINLRVYIYILIRILHRHTTQTFGIDSHECNYNTKLAYLNVRTNFFLPFNFYPVISCVNSSYNYKYVIKTFTLLITNSDDSFNTVDNSFKWQAIFCTCRNCMEFV